MTSDLQKLLDILPQDLQQALVHHPKRDTLIEVVLDLGRFPEARFPGGAEYLSETAVTHEHLQACIQHVSLFGGDNRAGIEQTLHRISAIRNRTGDVIGLTCRVGRAIHGTIAMIRDLVETGQSLLLLGRPGVGKTTALREIARVLADDLNKRVVIIDTSNEIAGDGDIPHPAIGRARRMQVSRPELQHQVMIEAVENHMPEVVVIDEIGAELEALAARTIAERGVQLVGTAHGNQIENLVKNPTLSDLVGGIQSVTLGDDEARRRGSQKSVLERKAPPTFDIAVEMLERQRWVVHESVAETVDALLRGRQPYPQVRTVTESGEVIVTQEEPKSSSGSLISPAARSRRQSVGQVLPFHHKGYQRDTLGTWEPTQQLSLADPAHKAVLGTGELDTQRLVKAVNGHSLHLYPYGISRQQLEHIATTLKLPVVLVRELDEADAILTLPAHRKSQSKLERLAKQRQIRIQIAKGNTVLEITRALQRLLGIDALASLAPGELSLFSEEGSEHELEALEEARIAVEQVVIPKGQPVELLPRSAKVRRLQHELIEHYQLKATSFGEEPNRRLRIYPA
ncbi:R3H domain-containing nucleic acid-binding protein [Pseudanabaena sp. FACHB-2040]|uniref:R3H domain-containing nucleic acid-binding protein n=1 Tax=Pseudanabaena sp. FACHB-2040 TaxID=2692859 RepID=UPI0016876C1B|nr:R3H domain-containing nucleic acid-binding protein [Pseudanabaena sp. FACHB-2040]MBD2256520.1 AAA family ATPase [Pseudanabaena sp. FACHB-2040]